MEKNVADPAISDEMVRKYDRLATPLIVIGDRVIWGFAANRAEIEKLLEGPKN